MKKLNIIEIIEELSENMTAEEYENLCETVKTELQKRDQRSIELAVKYHGELMAIAFLSDPIKREIREFSRNTQRFIIREYLS